MSSSVKDVIVDAGGKQDTQPHPLHASVSAERNSSVRRRCSDTDLEDKLHSRHIAFLPCTLCTSTFLCQCPRIQHFSFLEDRTLVGGLSPTRGVGKPRGVLSPGSRYLWKVVQPSGDCSSLQWCLAWYNLQNAHPFAEVWWMGGGEGGVSEGEGDGRL